MKRCAFLTNNLHLLLYTTVKISPFSGVKYLGIYLNQRLTWGDHCKFVHSKITRVLNLLRQKLYGCSQSAKCQSFCSLILPILQYSCQVWMPYYKKDIALIETVQKRPSKWICNSRFNSSTYLWDSPSSDCLVQLKWPSMSIRFTILSLKFFHNLLHQKLSINFSDFFSSGTFLPDFIV